jgi:hypothetical protein
MRCAGGVGGCAGGVGGCAGGVGGCAGDAGDKLPDVARIHIRPKKLKYFFHLIAEYVNQ